MLATAIAPPKTYSDWVAVLDMLKAKSDDEASYLQCREELSNGNPVLPNGLQKS